MPHLRIINDGLRQAVRERQASLQMTAREVAPNALVERRRPRHLFAGLTRCGCCGSGYGMISRDLLDCTTARNKGTCENRTNIHRDALEAPVLNGLRRHLMEPALFKEFCDEFTREVNRLRMEAGASLQAARSELGRIDRDLDRLIKLILGSDGLDGSKRVMKQMKLSRSARRNSNAHSPRLTNHLLCFIQALPRYTGRGSMHWPLHSPVRTRGRRQQGSSACW